MISADREIESKTRTLKRMKSQLYSIQAAQIKEDVVSGGVQITGEDRIIRALEYEKELIGELMDLFELKEKVRKKISKLSKENHRTLLQERYLNGYKMEEVADFMGYNPIYIYDVHTKALEEFGKVLNESDVL